MMMVIEISRQLETNFHSDRLERVLFTYWLFRLLFLYDSRLGVASSSRSS
jgi:hypothetical protein